MPFDPIPYTIRGDNLFTSLLLICMIVFAVSVSNTRQFVSRQLKGFFYQPLGSRNMSETTGELRFQFFLVLLGCLLLSISTFIYVIDYVSENYLLENYQMVAVFFSVFLGYILLKGVLYEIVNNVFFHHTAVVAWRKSALFLTALEGLLFFPIVLLQVYFDLSFENAVLYYGFVLFFSKILTFYKCWSIFFRQIGDFFQNILYFCTLEIVPLLILVGGMKVLIDVLKINF